MDKTNARIDIIAHPLFQYLADEVAETGKRLDSLSEENRYLHRRLEGAELAIRTLNNIMTEYELRMAAMESVLRRMLLEPVGNTSQVTQAVMEQEIEMGDGVTDDLERLLEEVMTEVDEDVFDLEQMQNEFFFD